MSPTKNPNSNMHLHNRIDAFVKLGELITKENESLNEVVSKACYLNPWFTTESIWSSLLAIKNSFLKRENLEKWLSPYNLNEEQTKRSVGLILAGNIPLVGFHDVLSVLLVGHAVVIKYSAKDKVLIEFLLDQLMAIEPKFKPLITSQERLKFYDAVIATGSDNSSKMFEKYFSHVPHVIRRNRNGVAIIHKDITKEKLRNLGADVFQYFGLGCRNVSKLYVENGFKLDVFFEAIYDYGDVISHNKYKNNYDYSNALLLLNNEKFLTNNFLILRPHKSISSRISTLNYEFFDDYKSLTQELKLNEEKIQCIVSEIEVDGYNVFDFGYAQKPSLSDYADGIDTIQFLKQL